MIKAVLFDFGGVLTPGGTTGCVQRIFGSIYGLDPALIDSDVDLLIKARQGAIRADDFFARMNRRHPEGERADRQKYLALADIFVKSDPVYNLASQLRKHKIATGILSNINDIAAEELERRGFYDGFDPVILSYREHLAKPQPEFYQLAISRLNMLPQEIVLVDDQEKCRPPAEFLGMRFILAKSADQIVRDVKTLLQKENGVDL